MTHSFSALVVFASLIASTYSYNLTSDTTLDLRTQYCRTNQYECSTNCNGAANVNDCDPNTSHWFCTCQNGFPIQSKYAFIMEVKQCEGELLECVNNCLATVSKDNNYCTATCKNQMQCGTATSTQKVSFNANPAPASSPNHNNAFLVANDFGFLSAAFAVILALF